MVCGNSNTSSLFEYSRYWDSGRNIYRQQSRNYKYEASQPDWKEPIDYMAHQILKEDEFTQAITRPPTSGVLLDEILDRAIASDAELRNLFRTSKISPGHVAYDPMIGLVNIFAAPEALRTTRARSSSQDYDSAAKHVMPLPSDARRPEGSPSVVGTINEFKRNWNILSEGIFSQVYDREKFVIGGGSVLAGLAPVPEDIRGSDTALRQFYHNEKYPGSDIDVFFFGMTKREMEDKIQQIVEAIRLVLPIKPKFVRTSRAITLYSQYPFRPVQFVLTMYQSPADILTSFDVDCAACLFDGHDVFMSPRAVIAAMQQRNTIDMTRRSRGYENRLIKYALRGFEIYVPHLERGNIDPGLFCRSIKQTQGLGRLIRLEKVFDTRHGVNAASALNGRVDLLDHRMTYGPGWSYNCTLSLVSGRDDDPDDLDRLLADLTLHDHDQPPQISRLDHRELTAWSADVYLDSDAMFFAAIAGHDETSVRAFLSRDSFDINRRNHENHTALHISILARAEDIAYLLIDEGIRITPTTEEGMTALHFASQVGVPSLVEKLLRRSNVNQSATDRNQQMDVLDLNQEDNDGRTPLCHAMVSGCVRSIDLLRAAGAHLNLVKPAATTTLRLIELVRFDPMGNRRVESAIVDVRRERGWLLTPKEDIFELDEAHQDESTRSVASAAEEHVPRVHSRRYGRWLTSLLGR